MRISDWSSDVCSSDLRRRHDTVTVRVEDALTIRSEAQAVIRALQLVGNDLTLGQWGEPVRTHVSQDVKSSIRSTVEGKRFFDDFPTKWLESHRRTACRSEEHTSELQSLMRKSYAVFCLTKKNNTHTHLLYSRKHERIMT